MSALTTPALLLFVVAVLALAGWNDRRVERGESRAHVSTPAVTGTVEISIADDLPAMLDAVRFAELPLMADTDRDR